MKQVRWAWLPILLVLLGACTTSIPPVEAEPEFMHSVDESPLHEGPRLAFLPPLGGSEATGVFDPNVPIDIMIFAYTYDDDDVVTGMERVDPTFSTSDGSIEVKNGTYRADWVVPTTEVFPYEYVRVEVRYAVGPDPEVPVCDSGAGGSCFGFFEARLVANSGNGSIGTPEGVLEIVRERTQPFPFFIRESEGTVPTQESRGNLRKIYDNEPFAGTDAAAPNCTEFDTPGQGLQAVGAGLQAVGAGFQAVGAGFQAVGAVGGLFRGEFEAETLTTTDAVAGDLREILGAGTSSDLVADMVAASTGPVALLVVDDFGSAASPVYELPADLFAENLEVTHGALVLDHVLSLLDAALGYVPQESTAKRKGKDRPQGVVVTRVGEGPTITYFATDSSRRKGQSVPLVLVKAVNTQGNDTDEIAMAIDESIPVVEDDVSYPHVVVNMSFAIVPCDASSDVEGAAPNLVDLNGDDVVSLKDYVLALGEINDLALGEINDVMSSESVELTSFITQPLDDDLLAFLSCDSGGQICGGADGAHSLVHVASSGNFGYPFPFFPAALESVVSVGSQDAIDGGYSIEKSLFSNGSEIMTPGALFIAATQEAGSVTEIVGYAGTSFSAPNVSVFTALDLARGDDARICEPGTESDLAELALADGDVDDSENLPLGEAFGSKPGTAIDAYCIELGLMQAL